jgi:hypothetical protein
LVLAEPLLDIGVLVGGVIVRDHRMGQVTVTLWTRKICGLHRNDFVIAAKIDSLAPAP